MSTSLSSTQKWLASELHIQTKHIVFAAITLGLGSTALAISYYRGALTFSHIVRLSHTSWKVAKTAIPKIIFLAAKIGMSIPLAILWMGISVSYTPDSPAREKIQKQFGDLFYAIWQL